MEETWPWWTQCSWLSFLSASQSSTWSTGLSTSRGTTRICETSWPPHFLDHLWSLWKFVHKSTMWLRWQLLKNFLDPGGPLHARALWSWTFLSFIFGFKMTWEVIKSYGPIVTSLFLCHVTFSSSSSCSCWPPPGCPSWSTPQRPARI